MEDKETYGEVIWDLCVFTLVLIIVIIVTRLVIPGSLGN